jgi:hypothetical protein
MYRTSLDGSGSLASMARYRRLSETSQCDVTSAH